MSKIEWCDITINPIVGCSKCSPGCENCYAEKFAARLAKNPNPKIAGRYGPVVDEHGKWNGHIKLNQSFLSSPKAANPDKKSTSKLHSRIFVGSMCDLFNLDAYVRFDEEYNQAHGWRNNCDSAKYVFWNLFNYFAKNPQNTFILLTKRPVEAAMIFDNTLNSWASLTGEQVPLPNVWLGVTVCNQEEADKKFPILMRISAAMRFASVEPMLGPVDVKQYLRGDKKLGWVIAGGETGPNARPIHPDWARCLRDQCLETETPFFFKSWGEWYDDIDLFAYSYDPKRHVFADRTSVFKIGKKYIGHFLDGVEYRQFPEVKNA